MDGHKVAASARRPDGPRARQRHGLPHREPRPQRPARPALAEHRHRDAVDVRGARQRPRPGLVDGPGQGARRFARPGHLDRARRSVCAGRASVCPRQLGCCAPRSTRLRPPTSRGARCGGIGAGLGDLRRQSASVGYTGPTDRPGDAPALPGRAGGQLRGRGGLRPRRPRTPNRGRCVPTGSPPCSPTGATCSVNRWTRFRPHLGQPCPDRDAAATRPARLHREADVLLRRRGQGHGVGRRAGRDEADGRLSETVRPGVRQVREEVRAARAGRGCFG